MAFQQSYSQLKDQPITAFPLSTYIVNSIFSGHFGPARGMEENRLLIQFTEGFEGVIFNMTSDS